jgi:hypothetical protein
VEKRPTSSSKGSFGWDCEEEEKGRKKKREKRPAYSTNIYVYLSELRPIA